MNPLKKTSISTKITIISTTLAAVFLGVSLGYAIFQMKIELFSAKTRVIENQISYEIEEVDEVQKEMKRTLGTLVNTPPIQGMIRAKSSNSNIDTAGGSTLNQWEQRLSAMFKAQVNAHNYLFQLRYIDNDGKEIVRVDYQDGKAIQVLKENLQNKSDRDYFIQANQTQKDHLYISKGELNKEGSPPEISLPHTPVIRYALPIFSEETNNREGIIIANVFLEEILLSHIKPLEGVNTYLVDESGSFIKHPDKSKEWGGSSNLKTKHNLYREFPYLSSDNFKDISGNFTSNNQLFFYAKIYPDSNNHQIQEWSIIQKTPTANIYKSINKALLNTAIIGILVFIILFFVFRQSINNILSPLKNLTDASVKISQGKFDQKIKITSKDEIGELADAFNKMSDTLKKSYTTLETKVEERTKDLEKKSKELEETLDDFYTVRLSLQKEMELGQVKEENEKIKNKIDNLKKENPTDQE